MIKKWLDPLIYSACIFTFLSLLKDSYRNPDSIEKYLGVSSAFILGLLLVILALLRNLGYVIPTPISRINRWLIFPVAIAATVGLSMLEYHTSDNYVYSLLNIHYQQFGIIALGSLVVIYLSLQVNWQQLAGHLWLLAAPLMLGSYLFLISYWPFNYLKSIAGEDGLIEWVQVAILLLATWMSFKVTIRLWQKKQYPSLLALIYLGVTVGLFAITGDEISWGQRLLGLSTPTQIAQQNTQSEVTFHNLEGVTPFIWQAYFLISIFGSFAWVIRWLLSKIGTAWAALTSLADFFLPPWFIAPNFFFLLLYQYQTRPGIEHTIGHWGEPTEVFLYLGVALFIWQVWLKIKPLKQAPLLNSESRRQP
ncbi:MAG TPA: hypothetical protein VF209_00050 [Patescibacteria group bacterium]